MKIRHSERLEKIHLVICTLAAFCLTVGFVIRAVIYAPTGFEGLFSMAMWVSSGIIIFYCIGWIAKAFLVDMFTPVKIETDENAETPAEFTEEAPNVDGTMYNDAMFSDSMLESAAFSE